MIQVEKILSGDKLALARLITQIENQTEEGMKALDELFPYTGQAHLIGITGSPGSGKSSLVNQVVKNLRIRTESQSGRIAVIAVDPTSPFSGGALLGDRVRMRELMSDPSVFIRSMASRGALGGLAHTTGMVAQVLDAAGFNTIIIETVGAGQTEVEIANLAHTVVVVEAPGMGDDIQAIKAGILETADILVVNKSDLSGAENTTRSLRSMLELARPDILKTFHHGPDFSEEGSEFQQTEEPSTWVPPVLQTIAIQGIGIDRLLDEIAHHKDYLVQSQEIERINRERLKKEINRMVKERLYSRWQQNISAAARSEVMKQLEDRIISPQQAVLILLDEKNS